MDPETAETQAALSDGWARDQEPPSQAPDGAGEADGLAIMYDFLRRQIADRPLTVLAATLGAGLLLGAMLSERR